MPNDAWRDSKKLTRFLTEVETALNKLIEGTSKLTRLTASELVLRPTYVEEFENLRDNMKNQAEPRSSISSMPSYIKKVNSDAVADIINKAGAQLE